MGSTDAQIVIVLRSGSPRPNGHLEVEGAPDRPFLGWLGLISVLDATIEQLTGRAGADGGAAAEDDVRRQDGAA